MFLKNLVIIFFTFCLLFVGNSFAKVKPETIVGIWLFDENVGNIAKDTSPNGKNNGVLQEKPKWVQGKFGKALEFDGTNGVEIANPEKFNFLTWTYVLWFKADQGGDYPNLIGRQFANSHGWTIHLDPAGQTFRIRIDTDGGINQVKTAPKNVRDGKWHHGAITHDDKNKKLEMYIDGVKGETIYAGNYKNQGGFLKIASPAVGAVNLNKGAIDEVAIFNVLLTKDEITDIMKNGLEPLASVSSLEKLACIWGTIKKR